MTLVGATTENPAFELNNALLSRARVYVLKRLSDTAIHQLLTRALEDERGLQHDGLICEQKALEALIQVADGDGRRALNTLEIAAELAVVQNAKVLTEVLVHQAASDGQRQFDKHGDCFYDQMSAMHKAMRGSSPDAALYWFVRMIDGGCDPLYIARRIIRMASEDIGNADPRALDIALNAWDVQTRLGSPEGELSLAQALIYLACAPKSNAVYKAYQAALQDVRQQGSLEVPLHLRNAPTTLQASLGHGAQYRYAHDEPEAYAAGEQYLPEALQSKRYYYPVSRGLEIKIAQKLAHLRQLDIESGRQRDQGIDH